MGHPSTPELLVLHGLRLKSFAPAEAVADFARLPLADVVAHLESFADRGLVRYREGALTGWMLLAAGRAEVDQLLAAELDASRARPSIDAAYRTFLEHNQTLLRVCTDWQLRPVPGTDEPATNDHLDPAYDAGVIEALRAIDDAVQPVCAELASVFDRFEPYGGRFAGALHRTSAGEHDWFTKPTIDSYHTVWFELHENLLTTLGFARGSEIVA